MRYHLESTLPIHAFQPLVKHSPFKRGMTLEGGGGGIIGGIGDAIGGVVEGIGDALAGVDSFVGDTIPGGWGTVAAIAVPYLAPQAMMGSLAATLGSEAAAAAALSAGTSAATGAIRGDDPADILKNAALSGATSYGLSSLGGAEYVPDEGSPYIDGTPPPSRDFDYIPDASRDFDYVPDAPVRDFDTTDVPSSDVPSRDFDTTETPSRDFDAGTFGEILPETFVPRDFDYVPSTSPEIIAASSNTTALSPEEKFELMMRNAQDAPISSNFRPAGEPSFTEDPFKYASNKVSDVYDYFTDPNRTISDMGSDLYKSVKANPLEYGIGALALSNMGGQQPQPQGQPTNYSSGYSPYTGGYGSSGGVADPYLLRNRINAANIYNPYTSRYAQGGEVKHFALGGISNALSRIGQPFEKAIIQPIGQALPFLKDIAPYAGILAAPFITNPAMAVGVGALSSGFGRPSSGFDMKRALMGGIAAYGASTVGAGLEAAGQEPTKSLVDTIGESYAVPGTEVPASTAAPKGFFRDTDAMQKGVGNLLSSDSDAATKAFGTKASIFKSGVPLVMGTSGMMAIDEANKMREEAERSAGAGRQEQADMLARIAKGRKRAEQAVRENPYMYAMGGSIDDELGGDYSAMGMDQGNMQKGLFGLGYAAGGTPRFLSGGGDGMSDSIPATIGGTQEARLADGEFVIPADVVSHLGNGSSKAGAKQLYSMMDRVRKARTGNEKQGRQIKPNKLMPA